ncbi:MAG: DUF3616 domain-containing protein [Sedimentisphaerales bacterium]|jgi:hypothetical protein|nr:DUF3616 domain-containing protein [Sedimentisphaerales bacterium]NLT78395.1 DUF3616 domain-containing protein [Planctomycetota bacterium]
MNGIRYRVLGGLAWVGGALLLLAATGCAEKEPSGQGGDAATSVPGRIEHVGSYSFQGGVLEDKDLSGIACISPTRGLIGADEGAAVQVVALSREDRTLRVLATVSLLGSSEEMDIEAIAAEGDCYYIVGSHGVAKNSGVRQPSRYTICRLRVDPTTGLPAGGEAAVTVGSLAAILERDATLKPHFARPLQQKGVNIEGLAIREGRLYVGLRNPNLDGYAFVLEVAADDVFAKATQPAHTLHRLWLGKGLGIREIVTAEKGFLLIAGNAGSEPSNAHPKTEDYQERRGYELFRWPGVGPEVEKIGSLSNPPGKAEAMTILEEGPDHTTVLVLFDGPKGGAPSVYRLR